MRPCLYWMVLPTLFHCSSFSLCPWLSMFQRLRDSYSHFLCAPMLKDGLHLLLNTRSAAATHSLFLPVLHLTNLMENLCKAAALLLPLPLRLVSCQFEVKLLFCPFSPLFCHERYQIYAIIHHSLSSLSPLFSCIFDLAWKVVFQKSAPSFFFFFLVGEKGMGVVDEMSNLVSLY